MKITLIFVAGFLAGAILFQSVFAQNDEFLPRPNRALNHIGIVVADYDAAYEFYTEVMGLKEAYTVDAPGVTPANARYLRVRDADNVEIEVLEFGPESSQYRAMRNWK
jgi:hypothetical protein